MYPRKHRLRPWHGLAVILAGLGACDDVEPASPEGEEPPLALALALDGPDLAAAGACATFTVSLLDLDGGELVAPTDLELTVEGPADAFSDDQCASPLSPSLAVSSGLTRLTFSARWSTPGAATILVRRADASAARALEITDRFDPAAMTSRALIVYNSNSPDGASLAEYYRQARGLAPSQVCPVKLPPGMVATPPELLAARDTIVAQCICPLIPATMRPSPCTSSQAAAIAAVSPISHLVLIHGIPQRLTATGWTTDDEGPSLAPFLASLIYRNEAIFGNDSKRRLVQPYPAGTPISQYPPPLDPATAPWTAFGYVQASDAERTRQLIDRTLAAEAEGFTGNIVVAEASPSPLSQFITSLTSSFAPECSDYLTHTPFEFGAPENSWPWATCRYGSTASSVSSAPAGSIPGELGTTIPNPVGVGLSLAINPWPNTQVGFDGFDVMRRWHRTAATCVELCRDHATPEAVAECRARSTDIFKELDTDCVGAAPGLLGYQLRSWPVQYMGFMPAGWTTRETGALIKSVPRTIATGGYQGGAFSDEAFVRLGTFDPSSPMPTCATANGDAPCPERVVGMLSKTVTFPSPLPLVGGERRFTIRIRYRNPASSGGALEGWGVFAENSTDQWEVGWHLLDTSHPSWTTLEFTAIARATSLNNATALTNASVVILVHAQKPALGWLDLDAVEIIDQLSGTSYLDPIVGGFAASGHEVNVPGDFAANVIDRLSGIGAWGSSSHFMTGGWAFSSMSKSVPMLFAGRTLGESLLAAGNLESGLIYADPLYRPVAVRLRAANGDSTASFTDAAEWDALRTFELNAMLGTAHLHDVRWALETCPLADAVMCHLQGAWTTQRRGVGAVEDHRVDIGAFVPFGTAPATTLVRARVWKPGDEAHALSSIVKVDQGLPK